MGPCGECRIYAPDCCDSLFALRYDSGKERHDESVEHVSYSSHFCYEIFGTFITRSGLIQSVHTFDEATLGYYFLGFLFFIIIVCTVMIVWRLPLLKSKNELDSFLSREASFLFNNLLLLGIGFATFWGTIFPIISEAVRGVKITVGPPFYNQVNVPIGLALLALIGIGPIMAWRRATWSNLKKNFLKPVTISLAGGVILFPLLPMSSRSEIYTYITFILCIFVTSTMLIEFLKGTIARHHLEDGTFLGALGSLIWHNKRRYGGYIVHIGVVMIYAGIAASQSYGTHIEKRVKIGDTLEIRDYILRYEKLVAVQATSVKTRIIAQLTVEKNGKLIWTARPEKEFYKGQNQPVSEVDVRSTLASDLYVILADFSEDESATIKVYHNPMVKWLWTGGWVIALGTVVCAWPDRLEQRRRLERLKRQQVVFAPAQE